MAKFKPKAVLFDLDGTLVDSAPDIAEALNDLMLENARPVYSLAEVKHMVGEGVHRLMEKAFGLEPGHDPAGTDKLAQRFLALYTPRATHLTKICDGVTELLDVLKEAGLPMAVCTNKPDAAAISLLHDLGLLPYFREVIGGASGLPRKPDPASLLEAARRLETAPEDCLMIGDALPDVLAARAARIPVVVVDSGYGEVKAEKLEADAVLAGFKELPKLLKLRALSEADS